MGKSSVSRRRFLEAAGTGGSIALAAVPLASGPLAAASAPAPNVSPTDALTTTMGQYAGTAFTPAEATRMAALLNGSVSITRSLNPPGYRDAAPASIYRIPADT